MWSFLFVQSVLPEISPELLRAQKRQTKDDFLIKDDLLVVLLMSCFMGHSVQEVGDVKHRF